MVEEFNLLQMDLPQVNETLYALNEVRIESLDQNIGIGLFQLMMNSLKAVKVQEFV